MNTCLIEYLVSAVGIIGCSLSSSASVSFDNVVFVDPGSSVEGDGSFSSPFNSIGSARDFLHGKEIGKNNRGVIFLRGGIYSFSSPLNLTEEDSFVTIIPWGNERVEFTGGVFLDNEKFRKVSEVEGKQFSSASRLKPGLVGKVYVYDLGAEGIPVGTINKNGFSWESLPLHPELYVDGVAQTLAQYPDGDGYIHSDRLQCIDAGDSPRNMVDSSPAKSHEYMRGLRAPVFRIRSLPPSSGLWAAPEGKSDNRKYDTDGWLSGCFAETWSDDNCRIDYLSGNGSVINCMYPSWYGVKEKNLRLKAVNLLCELDHPGEYYIDRYDGNDVLYYYPEDDSVSGKDFLISVSDSNILSANATSGLCISGIVFSGTVSEAISFRDCDNTVFDRCEIYGIGKDALKVSDNAKTDANNLFSNCTFHDLGYGAVYLLGGNNNSLARGGDTVRNCEFHSFSRQKGYTPAITLHGVAHTASYNYIHDAPHMVIRIYGNDHLISHNKIVNTCMNTSDMAPIYIGRDLMMLGNEISFNYIDGVNPGRKEVYAVYFDDSASGGIIRGNIIRNIGDSGILPNKGFGYYITDNIFIDIPGSHILFSTYGTPQWKRPVPNEADLKTSFFHRLATKEESVKAGVAKDDGAVSGLWNSRQNIRRWVEHYDSLYNSLPDFSRKPEFRFSLEKKYFPAAGNATSAFSDPNSLLCGSDMTIMRNITANAGDLTVFRSLYGGSNSSYTDPETFDTYRFRAYDAGQLGLDLTTGRIDSGSPLAEADGFGPDWIEDWNKNFTLDGIGPLPAPDKSHLWKALESLLSHSSGSAVPKKAIVEAMQIAADPFASDSQIEKAITLLRKP